MTDPGGQAARAIGAINADLIRAAEHMISVYGADAAGVATRRSENAYDLAVVRRWRVIAATICRLLDDRSGTKPPAGR